VLSITGIGNADEEGEDRQAGTVSEGAH
jgi:hypothetical protein